MPMRWFASRSTGMHRRKEFKPAIGTTPPARGDREGRECLPRNNLTISFAVHRTTGLRIFFASFKMQRKASSFTLVFVGAVFASLFEALTSAQLELQRAVFVANAELADLETSLRYDSERPESGERRELTSQHGGLFLGPLKAARQDEGLCAL